jgi:hypothetical protein
MIRLDLGPGPAALESSRSRRWPFIQRLYDAHGAQADGLKDELDGYDVGHGAEGVKQVLYARQHGKCAWCEVCCDWEDYPIEHIRPKARADDLDDAAKAELEADRIPPDLGLGQPCLLLLAM